MNLIMLDNQDSFVYNLVDAWQRLITETVETEKQFFVSSSNRKKEPRVEVYRNNLPAQLLVERAQALNAPICLSPGPGTPQDAGCLMEVIRLAQQEGIGLIGICLGFQALLAAAGSPIKRVGPTHGQASPMFLTPQGETVFAQASALADSSLLNSENPGEYGSLMVARYHSLGATELPTDWSVWGKLAPEEVAIKQPLIMAAGCKQKKQAGVQFHPESILTPQGPQILRGLWEFVA